jgi:thiamine transport system permease protein
VDRTLALDHGVSARGRLGTAVAWVVLAAVALPVGAVLLRALRDGGSWDASSFGRMLGTGRTWRVVAVTVAQAAGSAALTVAVGVPVAWVLARYRFPGRRVVAAVAVVPFVLPTVVVGAAFATLLGPTGVTDLRGTWWAVLAAHLCFNLAVVLRIVGAAVAGLDPDIERAARLLGAGPLGGLRRVVAPAVAPAVAAAGVVVFLFCLTSFGILVILGGGSVTTVEVEIWVRATRQFDLPGAAVLAAVQLVAVIATLAVYGRITRRSHAALRAPGATARRGPRSLVDRLAVGAAVGAVLVIAVVPVLALLERSLRVGDGWGTDHWLGLGSALTGTALAVSPAEALAFSAVTATAAAATAVALGVPAAFAVARRPGGVADRVLLLPLGVSATTLGLGLVLAVGRPPVDLRRSWWLVPAAQALIALPLVVRVVADAVRRLPPNVLDAAAVLGASPADARWRVEVPLVRGGVVAGAGLALLACLGEFGATVFLARSDRPTVPVAIARLLSRPGAAGFGQAMALSCLLAAVCVVVLFVVDRADTPRLTPGRAAASCRCRDGSAGKADCTAWT